MTPIQLEDVVTKERVTQRVAIYLEPTLYTLFRARAQSKGVKANKFVKALIIKDLKEIGWLT